MTIKDCFETASLLTTSGYPPLAKYVPTEDAPTVAKWRAAGAVVIGKTNLPALAGDSQTDNEVFGRTNNPWDLGLSPGGSSGGEGAAVAARLSPLGLGSDIGGSIRQPSHCCAIFGLKPTEHLVSTAGYLEGRVMPRAERHMNTIGPMARSVADLELGLRAVAGPDRRFLETPPISLGERTVPSMRSLRVAWTRGFPGVPMARVVGDSIASLAAELAGFGAKVDEVLPTGYPFESALETFGALYQAELGPSMSVDEERIEAERWGAVVDANEPFLRGMAYGVNATVRRHAEILTERDRLAVMWEQFFDEWDVLLCPVSQPALSHCPFGAPQTVDGKEYPYGMALDSHTAMFNLTGHPAVAMPLGITDEGRPFGYQAVGRRWSDIGLLGTAEALSLVSGPSPIPPGY